MTVRVEVDARNALRELGGMTARARDLRPAFRAIDKHVSQVLRRQFVTEGAAGGRPWKPLKPATLAAKKRIRRAGMGILRRYNRLYGSLVKVGPNSIRRVTHQTYERGTRIPYAAPHQTGTRDRRLPERQVIPDPMPRSVVRAWDRRILRHLEGGAPDALLGL